MRVLIASPVAAGNQARFVLELLFGRRSSINASDSENEVTGNARPHGRLCRSERGAPAPRDRDAPVTRRAGALRSDWRPVGRARDFRALWHGLA